MISATGTRTINTAFTLIELICVMVLTVALLAVTAPRLARFSRSRVLHGEAERLLTLLQAGRDRAAAESATYQLSVDPDERSYRLMVADNGEFVAVAESIGAKVCLPKGIEIEVTCYGDEAGQADAIDLTADGRSTAGRITLTDAAENAVHVACRTPLEPFIATVVLEEAQP